MGTPEFSIPSLDILVKAGYDIVAVVTAPDRPAGRGRKLRPSPVKEYAITKNIPILQPEKLRNPEFIEKLKELSPDLMVVVAFRMLPEMVWSIPHLGTFNLHASLLPDYRGAAPINWVLINGEKSSGATTFLIDHKIDTGNLLLQEEVEIPFEWNAGDLHDCLMEKGAELVLRTVQGLGSGSLTAKPQDESLFQHKAPKIFKEDCKIDWNQPALQAYNLIRGLSPYPAAWTTVNNLSLKILKASLTGIRSKREAGSLQIENDQSILISCADEWLKIEELQLQGKKRMKTADFLRGFRDTWTKVV